MRKFLTAVLIFCAAGGASAQNVIWSEPTVVSGADFGYTRPRIAVCNNVPVAVWGNQSTKAVYGSRFINGVFSDPVLVTPPGFEAFVFDWTAHEIAAAGDTLFVSFSDAGSSHAYLVRSTDGGITFSDTVRVDNIGTDLSRFSTVETLYGGNPVVMFMRFDSAYSNPRYVVAQSMNGGASFMPDVNASGIIPGEPCDCCPGSLVNSGDKTVLLYRNNDDNIRDSWVTISTNNGASFDSGIRIDSSNWMLMSCPSSGPHGYVYGDTLVSVFMNGNGGTKVLASALDLNTLQPTSQKQIADITGAQNFPRIAGVNDTLGVVWQQKIGTPSKIVVASSYSGFNGLGGSVDTLSLSLSNSQTVPDIAYGDGKFHVVFSDAGSHAVYYTSGTLPFSTEAFVVANNPNGLMCHWSEQGLELTADKTIGDIHIRVYAMTGALVLDENIQSMDRYVRLEVPNISSGLYFVSIYGNEINHGVKTSVVRK